MKAPSIRPARCAIYTRVSTEHGLDQEFNSLDAQYDAASAYIKRQAHAGWTLVRSRYDDGGYSGGSTDGPDLQRLLDDSRTTLHKLSRDGDNVWRGAPLLSIHERGWRTPGPGGVAVLDLQVTGILLRSRHPEGDESSRARLVDTPMLYAMVEAARSFWNRCPIVSRRRAGGVAILMEALDRDIQVKNEFSVLGLRNRGS
jgi:hypothetical protein